MNHPSIFTKDETEEVARVYIQHGEEAFRRFYYEQFLTRPTVRNRIIEFELNPEKTLQKLLDELKYAEKEANLVKLRAEGLIGIQERFNVIHFTTLINAGHVYLATILQGLTSDTNTVEDVLTKARLVNQARQAVNDEVYKVLADNKMNSLAEDLRKLTIGY